MSTLTYEWQWRSQLSFPAPVKTMGSNNGAWAGAASLYLSGTNQAGQDISSTFRTMKAGDTVRVEHKTDSTLWSLWTLAVAPVDYGPTFTFPASKMEYHGPVVDNLVYRVTLNIGVGAQTQRLSIGEHLCNLSMIAAGMLNKENINLSTVGDDAIQVYDKLVRSYLETPELPQPVPPPALPKSMAL